MSAAHQTPPAPRDITTTFVASVNAIEVDWRRDKNRLKYAMRVTDVTGRELAMLLTGAWHYTEHVGAPDKERQKRTFMRRFVYVDVERQTESRATLVTVVIVGQDQVTSTVERG